MPSLLIFACALFEANAFILVSNRTHSKERLNPGGCEGREAVFVQFDTRDPKANYTPTWLKALTAWNKIYVEQFACHRYALFNLEAVAQAIARDKATLPQSHDPLPSDCTEDHSWYSRRYKMEGPRGCLLHVTWGKVRAMLLAEEVFPDAAYFVFFDSDAAVNYQGQFMNTSIPQLFSKFPRANGKEMPFYATLDDRSEWAWQFRFSGPWYPINTGMVFWRGQNQASKLLRIWWQSAVDDYNTAHSTDWNFTFRSTWPFDQDRMYAMKNDPYYADVSTLIQPLPEIACTKTREECDTVRAQECHTFERIAHLMGDNNVPAPCFGLHFTNRKDLGSYYYNKFLARHGALEDLVPTPIGANSL